MDHDFFYREPIKVNERQLANEFEEFCYLNGGYIVGDDYVDGQNYDLRCRIEGYGELHFGKKVKMKRIKIKELTPPLKSPLLEYLSPTP